MRRNQVSSVVLAAALSACALEPELLNSDRIMQRFGSYGIEVLEQDDGLRRSNLYSVEDGTQICRTYAVVRFMGPEDVEVGAAHQDVLAGQSIGATFKESGWRIGKDTVYIGSVAVSGRDHEVMRLMHLSGAATVAAHIYRLLLERDSQSLHYATIFEVHHPEYLSEAELHELYDHDVANELDAASVAAFVEMIRSD